MTDMSSPRPAGLDLCGMMYFSETEARLVEAMAARIIPSEPGSPGAREADVVAYIDRAVAGYFRDLQGLYREGARRLDTFCRDRYGSEFANLTEEEQDGILHSLDTRHGDGEGVSAVPAAASEAAPDLAAPRNVETDLLARFFEVVRDHTIQGLFGDPMYGGNRDKLGWKLIGFPGAQWEYTPAQMRPGFDATIIPIQTLADLQRRHSGQHDA